MRHDKNSPDREGKTLRRWVIAVCVLVVLAAVYAGVTWRRSVEETGTAATGRTEKNQIENLRITEAVAPEDLNIILITIDTLRADHLGSYGYRDIETPHIDALAREGVRFSNAASTVPFTLPAHSSIMTGIYPPSHGVRENVGYFLADDVPTAAELLAAAGYETAGFVSAFVLDGRWGIGRGFDHYFDDFETASLKQINLASVQRDGRETVAEAVRWLDRERQAPFFLWLHLFEPHDPYKPPEPFLSRYPERPYDGEIAYADALIGEFRDVLEERALLEKSLLVLTGDHGEGLGDHDEGYHGFFVYDSTIHVPLIVRAPFGELGGRVVTDAVSHVDLLPTILDAVGQPVSKGAQGVSLIPLMLGSEAPPDRSVYSESYYSLFHYGWAPLRAIRTAGHKFIDAPRPELYDIIDDRQEERNLVEKQQRLASDLEKRLDVLVESIDSPEKAEEQQPDLDEATLQQLRALGYVAGRGEVSVDREHERDLADPKDKIKIHQMFMVAQSDVSRGDEEAAERRLKKVLESDPGLIDAHQMLGNIASQRQEYNGAAENFRRALELDSDHRTSLYGLANAYRRLGRYQEALLGFERLQALSPHDSKAVVSRSDIYVEQQQLHEALRVIGEAAQLEAAPAMVHNKHGELLTLVGRPAEAVPAFERAMTKNDALPQPYFNLAVLYEELGRLDQAMAFYEQAIERAPTHFQAQFNLGRLYGHRRDLDRQQELYETAIESNPEFVRGYFFLAKLIMDRGGDLDRAEELARQGLDKDPENRVGPIGYFLLADILNRQGRHAEEQQVVQMGRRIQAETK
jgi:arylsulfatase A-like enzyme/Tfp pilus assembly protein PilF